MQDILDRATALKAQGNAEFGKGQFELAMATYREGLVELPVRTEPGGTGSAKGKAVEGAEVKEGETKDEKVLEELEALNLEPSQKEAQEAESEEAEMKELNELRSILFANVAACCIKMVGVIITLALKFSLTPLYLTGTMERGGSGLRRRFVRFRRFLLDLLLTLPNLTALEDNTKYIKALQRRAMANESINSWSSLTSALEGKASTRFARHTAPLTISLSMETDTKTLEALPDLPTHLRSTIRTSKPRLEKAVAEAQAKEQAEVMDKLKDLGNTVLGAFCVFNFSPSPLVHSFPELTPSFSLSIVPLCTPLQASSDFRLITSSL